MNRDHINAMFLLAGIPITGNLSTDENPYWGSVNGTKPRWIVPTARGNIKLHCRKRVIEINWEDTILRFPMTDQFGRNYIDTDRQLTNDDVTQNATIVHADTFAKCIEYLTRIWSASDRALYLADFIRRKGINKLTEHEVQTMSFLEATKDAGS